MGFFGGTGVLKTGGHEIQIPADTWLHFEITVRMDPDHPSWDLSVRELEKKKGAVLEDMRFNPKFTRLTWLGWYAHGDNTGKMWLDNVELSGE